MTAIKSITRFDLFINAIPKVLKIIKKIKKFQQIENRRFAKLHLLSIKFHNMITFIYKQTEKKICDHTLLPIKINF